MSFFLSENSEKRHLFTLATPFLFRAYPLKTEKVTLKVTLNSLK